MKFRYDVNALRALAVILVMVFHYNPNWLPSGFIGVDVFFVISGYLMTLILVKSIENNQISYIYFVKARIKRIVPAVLFLLICLSVYFYFYMYSYYDYKMLLKHGLSSISFVSNIVYWSESGYFDELSSRKFLLHTWSLSVEWQFYIIFPLVIYLIHHVFKKNMGLVIYFITVLFFIISYFIGVKDATSSYYLLHTRAWEMLVGSCAYYYGANNGKLDFNDTLKNVTIRNILTIMFISIILASSFIFDSNVIWPGLGALVPVLATFFLIILKSDNLLFKFWPLQFIGKCSYSLYLWHWPLIVAINEGYLSSVLFIPLLVLMSLISYYLVESRSFTVTNIIIACIIFSVFLSSYYFNGDDKDNRSIAASDKAIYMNKAMKEKDLFPIYSRRECNVRYSYKLNKELKRGEISESCFTRKNKNAVLLWGDSYAFHLYHGLKKSLNLNAVDILQVATSSCRVHNLSKNKDCQKSNELFWTVAKSTTPDIVLISQYNQYNKVKFEEIATKLYALGVKKVIVLGPSPTYNETLRDLVLRNNLLGKKYVKGYLQDGLIRDVELKNRFLDSGISYLSVFDEICNESGCMSYVKDKNDIFNIDKGHYSRSASEYIAQSILIPEINKYIKF